MVSPKAMLLMMTMIMLMIHKADDLTMDAIHSHHHRPPLNFAPLPTDAKTFAQSAPVVAPIDTRTSRGSPRSTPAPDRQHSSMMSASVLCRFTLRLSAISVLFALLCAWQIGRSQRFSPFFSPDVAALTADETRVTEASNRFLDDLLTSNWNAPTRQMLYSDYCVVVSSGRVRRKRYVRRAVVGILREWIALDDADPLKLQFQVHVIAPPVDELSNSDLPHVRDYAQLSALVHVHSEPTHAQFLSKRVFAREIKVYEQYYREKSPQITADELAAKVEKKRQFFPYWDREIGNYVRALEACLPVSKYTLVIEDDAVAARDMPRLLAQAVNQLEAIHAPSGGQNTTSDVDWAWIKLFHTERFMGWSIATLPLLLACAFAPAAIVGVVLYVRVSRNLALIVALQVAIVALILLVGLGRQAWFRSAPAGLAVSDVDCCIPAQLYNNRVIPRVIKFLRHPPYLDPVDRLLDEFRRQQNATLRQYMLVPHLFQHIGRFASYPGKNQGRWDKMVVSTSFEGERAWSTP
jgi:hypothetical protein